MSPTRFFTESEASASDASQLVGQLNTEPIHTCFIETQTSPRLVNQVVFATDVRSDGELCPEYLKKDGQALTYVAAFIHNDTAMVNSMK